MNRASRNLTEKSEKNLGTRSTPSGKSSDLRSQNESRPVPTLKMLAWMSERDTVSTLTEFHMTIRLRVTEFSTKSASMLLSIAVAKGIYLGVDITLYMAMEFLTSYLKRSGTDVLYEKNEKIRQTLLLSELVLSTVKGTWLTMSGREKLPEDIIEQVHQTGWLPSERTLNSWKTHWDLEKYLQVRIVPVESLLERQPSTAERYSGYTKGYGQDGNPPAPHKTKDEPVDGNVDPDLPSITLQEFGHYVDILNSIERSKALKRKR